MSTYLNLITDTTLYGVMGADWTYARKDAPMIRGDKGGWWASATFYVRVESLIPFVTNIGGAARTIVTSWGSMSRIQTLRHPLYTGLFATRVESEAFGEADTNPAHVGLMDQFSHAKIRVEFENYPYGIEGDQAYFTMESRAGGVFQSIPGWGKYTFTNGEKMDGNQAVFVPQTSYALTFYQCPNLNDTAMDALTGCINSAPFLGKPAGQLKFDGWTGSLSSTVGGVTQYVRQAMMTYQGYSWNKFYRSDGALDTPVDGSSLPVFASSNFNGMFN